MRVRDLLGIVHPSFEPTAVAAEACIAQCLTYHRASESWIEMVSAWPRWSVPVTLGGGSIIVKLPASAALLASARQRR